MVADNFDITQLTPEEVIVEEHLPFYKKGMDFFYLQLVHLNVNIYILDHILDFPFHLFTDTGKSLFFRKVFENFFYASVLIITRIAVDQGSDLFTLPRFKNRIRNYVIPIFQPTFDATLRKSRFDASVNEILKKACNLRNESLAHIREDIAFGQQEQTIFTFGEIKSLRDELGRLFNALAFNTYYIMWPDQYDPNLQHPKGVDSRSDIEEILDLLAEKSILLNLPETSPQLWAVRKEIFSEKDLKDINRYREKFDLPSA